MMNAGGIDIMNERVPFLEAECFLGGSKMIFCELSCGSGWQGYHADEARYIVDHNKECSETRKGIGQGIKIGAWF